MGQKKYIWEKPDWPLFKWNSEELLGLLGQARKAQGQIIAQAALIGLEEQAQILVEEAFTTSAIEGEKLDRNSIRSSVARRLGLPTAGLAATQQYIDGLVEMLTDATTNYKTPLTPKRLFGWHAALFPTGHSGIKHITVGAWRKGKEPMQVVSGPMEHPKVHFEAPPSKNIKNEMDRILGWWNKTEKSLDGILRAGIAHFWFVTIHPFDDGNGRITRAITDMALAQDEKTGRRLYGLSSQINRERDAYYDILEKSQRETCDITEWLKWFLGLFSRAIGHSQEIIEKALSIAKFWQIHSQAELNPRQVKVVNKLLEAGPGGFEGGITNRKYVGINKVSPETAKRDLANLEKRRILKRNEGGGRSVSYSLRWD